MMNQTEFAITSGLPLCRIGRAAVPALIEGLESVSTLVRREAALALKTIGDRDAIPALERRCHDDDQGVAQAAADAVAMLQSSEGSK
jgi:HEAT repeat protein